MKRQSWLRYIVDPENQKTLGIQEIDTQLYLFRDAFGLHSPIKSMLSIYEIGLLYALARDHWQGRGLIIDGGPLLGASTFAFGLGLFHNDRAPVEARKSAIYSYDLWIADEYYTRFINRERMRKSPSLLPEFLSLNRQFIDYIVPHQGDFCSWAWKGEPIEILFMDLAKSWELNTHYVRNMLPFLIEDGVLVQQDYVHFNEYWVHLVMEHFSGHFQFSDVLYGATAFYRVTTPLSAEECAFDLQAMPYAKKMDLLTSARAKMPQGVQEVMKCAAAKCAIEHGDIAEAEALISTVQIEPLPDPVENFSGIAHSNRDVVLNMISAVKK